MISLISCVQNGQSLNYCTIIKPIYFDKSDKLSVATEKAIIEHDETWEKLCK
jgi:hypothetical protein